MNHSAPSIAAILAFMLLCADASADTAIVPEPFAASTFWVDQEPVPDLHRRTFDRITTTSDGRVVLLGLEDATERDSDDVIFRDLVLVAIAPDGTEEWRRYLETEESHDRRLIAAPGGDVLLCDGISNYYRVDRDGQIVWHHQYKYPFQATCDEMEYHESGLLLVAGQRPYDNVIEKGTEAALTAYDAGDGSVRWQVGYRPYDVPPGDLHSHSLDMHPLRTVLRVRGDTIDWLGWARVERGRLEDRFTWSLEVRTDGMIIGETPVHKFMADNPDGFVGAVPTDALLLENGEHLILWKDGEWQLPRYLETALQELFAPLGWPYPIQIAVIGGNAATFSLAYLPRPDDSAVQKRLDLMTVLYRWRGRPLRFARSIQLPDAGYEISAIVTREDFDVRVPMPISLLARDASRSWRIDRIDLE